MGRTGFLVTLGGVSVERFEFYFVAGTQVYWKGRTGCWAGE